MASLHVSAPANSFAIGDFWSFQIHFRVVSLLHLGNDYLNVLLAGPGDQEFFRLRVAEEAQHRIFFHELVNADTQFVLVSAGLRLDRKRDGRFWQLHVWILNRR